MPKKPTQTELGKKLLRRRNDLDAIVSENKIVEDVLSGRSAIIGRTSRKLDSDPLQPIVPMPAGIEISQARTGVMGVGSDSSEQSPYIPKHNLESGEEYKKRLDMTPFDAETPRILQSRQGAMFRKPPDIKYGETEENQPPEWLQFVHAATITGMSLLDVIVKIGEVCQVGGFGGVLVDREILPQGLTDRSISQADVRSQGLGRVILAPYAAHQICDYAQDRHGLVWVKLVEKHGDYNATWDGAPKEVYTVRVVDRVNITVWDVERIKQSQDFFVSEPVVIPHAAVDAMGKPIVPFRLFHPFPARDGIGRSNLRSTADFDVAAIRVLSDWMFILHQMAPLLVLKTWRDKNELANIGLGSSYLNVLAMDPNTKTTEELAYVQLDATSADKLETMYGQLCAKASDSSNKSADVGVTGPVEQSGISKAWTFKTGEERVLFLLGNALQEGFKWILELAARNMKLDGTQVGVAFPDSYDVTGMPEQLAMAEQVAGLFQQFGVVTPIRNVLRRVGMQVMHSPTRDETKNFDNELNDMQTPEQALMAQAVSDRITAGENDEV